MKKILLIISFCFSTFAVFAQVKTAPKTPQLSPEAAFTQQFGGTEIQVQYARPSVRGRKIFGALVPYDSLWRTGAGACTVLSTKEEIIIGDKILPSGSYSLFTIPSIESWTVVLNSDTTLHGTKGYNAQNDVLQFSVKPIKSVRFYETFTIEINDFTQTGSASLNIIWENTFVKISLQNSQVFAVQTQNSPKTDSLSSNSGHDMSKMDMPMPESIKNATENKPDDLKTQFTPVLSAYFALKDALVADNSSAAAQQAKTLKSAFDNLDTKTWTAKARINYEEIAKNLETDAQHIGANAGKIDHQREHFITLSSSLSKVAKILKITLETTYVQFCPMANDGKGAYWLSKEEKIRNPYYGKKMLTCGSTKEILK